MTTKQVNRLLQAKIIARVDLDAEPDLKTSGGGIAQRVSILLADGTALDFHVQEMADGGEYGISMSITRPGKPMLFTDKPGRGHARRR